MTVTDDLGSGSPDFPIDVETLNPLLRVLTWPTVALFLAPGGLGLLPFPRERGKRRRARRRTG